jgi:hypothetical protein
MRGSTAPVPSVAGGDGLPPDAPRGRRAELMLAGQMLAEFRAWAQTHTEFIARLAGNVVNDVLRVKTATFDANGTPIGDDFHVPCGTLEIENLGTHPMTVANRTDATGSAPSGGVGVRIIPAGAHRYVPIGSRSFTIYGTAGDQVSYAAYTRSVAGGGLGAVDGGAP